MPRPLQVHLIIELLTRKVVSESRVMWATSDRRQMRIIDAPTLLAGITICRRISIINFHMGRFW